MNRETFYQGTKATFIGCRRPSRKPDYTSYNRRGNVSSEYWYSDKGVIRCSNHWSIIYNDSEAAFECGKVASCYWRLRTVRKNTKCGFAPWTAFHEMKQWKVKGTSSPSSESLYKRKTV